MWQTSRETLNQQITGACSSPLSRTWRPCRRTLSTSQNKQVLQTQKGILAPRRENKVQLTDKGWKCSPRETSCFETKSDLCTHSVAEEFRGCRRKLRANSSRRLRSFELGKSSSVKNEQFRITKPKLDRSKNWSHNVESSQSPKITGTHS